MNDHELFIRAGRLAERGEPFVLASVVRREAPSSARVGDRALVDGDGELHGWLGGSCVEPVVRREARQALREGSPRLLVFAPDGDADRPGARVFPMHCHSGGTVEIYLQPELPAPVLALYGDSPVNRALSLMGRAAGYSVKVVGAGDADAYPGAELVDRLDASSGVYAVVATMGEWDEEAVEQAMDAGAGYVGLVASPRRAGEVRRSLGLERGSGDPSGGGGEPDPGRVGADASRLVSPAGLDLGAEEPAEIAVTILAEIIQRRHAGSRERDDDATSRERDWGAGPSAGEAAADGAGADSAAEGAAGETADDVARVARDPVCGMEVEVEEARHVAERNGTTHYFCSAGCRRSFIQAGAPES